LEDHDTSIVDTSIAAAEPAESLRDVFTDDGAATDGVPNACIPMLPAEQRFFNDGCGCVYKCTTLFPKEEILESRWNCLETNYWCSTHINHQNVMLKGALNCLTRSGPTTTQQAHARKARQKSFTEYRFRGMIVCRKFFEFANGVGTKKLKNEKQRFLQYGMMEVMHQNTKNTHRALSPEALHAVVRFITAFAQQHALVLPGRLPTYRLNPDLLLLPCTMSKAYLY
jgi:hypothetical protein